MENVENVVMDDDPYCLDDEPKATQKQTHSEEVTIVHVDFKTIEAEIDKDDDLLVQVPTNKKTSCTHEDGGIKDVVKKPKKKSSIWTKTSTRKGNSKAKHMKLSKKYNLEETLEINDTKPCLLEEINEIQLSKDQKADRVELSTDKLQASSEKGYRMVRATRGVIEGAWYYEIIIKALGETGHTRLGWSTWKGDLQAPVGFDINSYAYRDVDGSKVHQAKREPYGEGYCEGDVIGFYINLPNGAEYAPTYDLYVYKASKSLFSVPFDNKNCPLKHIPGSEISFFKNGVWQGVAFNEIMGGEYFPAASMYTLPSPEKKCSVRFNFGPDFIFPPTNWSGRPIPQPMSKALPPKSLAIEPIQPSPTLNCKETKQWKSRTKSNRMQQMVAKQGFDVVLEEDLFIGNEGVSQAKLKNEACDKGKRIRVYGKKGIFGRGRGTIGLFPNPIAKKPRICNISQHKRIIRKNCRDIIVKNIIKAPVLVENDTDSYNVEIE